MIKKFGGGGIDDNMQQSQGDNAHLSTKLVDVDMM